MATFVTVWENRQQIIQELVARAREADVHREREYRAAVTIQSWFRGCRVRAYLTYLHECATVIQKNFRAHLGRGLYRQRLKECWREMRQKHYNKMAARIQGAWRGYYVRKYVFNYYAQKSYLEGLKRKNEIVRQQLRSHWERVEEQRLQREGRLQELQTEEEARRYHYMLSTQSMDGVFKPSNRSEPLPFEAHMRQVRFPPRRRGRAGKPQGPGGKKRTLSCGAVEQKKDSASGQAGAGRLPPLQNKVQGPFRDPSDVWRQRMKPTDPTLRVATAYNSEEIARAELKAQEWRSRVIDEKFLPFSRKEHQYNAMLHTKSPFAKPLYGTKRFRDEDPQKNVSKSPFRIVVPPIPVFESLNATY